MLPCHTLSPQQFAMAFPFHLVLDRDLRIVQAGHVLERIFFGELTNSPLERFFTVDRPKVIELDFEVFRKHLKSLFILKACQNNMQLKGQISYVEASDLLFFLGSPWVTDISGLAPLGIKLKDFAIHDPVVDFIFLLQARDTSLNEAKNLTISLTQQQSQLRNALVIKENLAKIAEAQSKRLELALKELQSTQAQLVQTEKMSSLGQMVAGVAHEINNPVNFIHGNLRYVEEYSSQLLQLLDIYEHGDLSQPVSPEQFAQLIDLVFLKQDLPKTIASMRMGTERIREIVNSLRNFSRLDEAEHKIVDIHEGLDSTLLILGHRFKSVGERAEIKVTKLYGDLPPIECYAGQLNQVFMNLISNAIDALEEWDEMRSMELKKQNPSQITIATCINEHDLVQITIADNGPGIPEELQSRLFDPFFTTKPVGKGTGLGLSISYQIIIEKHYGDLTCVSNPEHGTTFVIELPQLLRSQCLISPLLSSIEADRDDISA